MNERLLILVSFILGITLWGYVYLSENKENVIEIPVVAINDSTGMISVATPKTVSVRVSSPRGYIPQSALDSKVEINATSFEEGVTYIQISAKDISELGMNILEISPNVVEISTAPTIRKRLPVSPYIFGYPQFGFKLGKVASSPEIVRAEGRYSDLALLNEAQTEKIDLSGVSANGSYTVKISPRDGVKAYSPNEILVEVEILEDIISRSVPIRAQCDTAENVQYDNISLPVIDVLLEGRADLVDEAASSAILVSINCELFMAGMPVPVSLATVDGVKVTSNIGTITANRDVLPRHY